MPTYQRAAILLSTLTLGGAAHGTLPPTVVLEGAKPVQANGLPLYGFERFVQSSVDLAGAWELLRVPGNADLSLAERTPEVMERLWAEAQGRDAADWTSGELPRAVAEPPEIYEETVWYRRSFRVDGADRGRWLLRFEGVGYVTDVWLNGVWLGYHEGAYTPFTSDATGSVLEHNGLLVRAAIIPQGTRNDVVPYAECDFWNYGGILRDVSLAWVPDTHIASARAYGGADGSLRVHTTVRASTEPVDGALSLSVIGPYEGETGLFTGWDQSREQVATAEAPVSLAAGESREVEARLQVDAPALWTPDHPALYLVTARIGQDNLTVQTGFRTLGAHDGLLMLNGEPIRLFGAARHEEMPGRWQSVAWSDWPAVYDDLARIKALNCNFVRIGHYPAHPMTALVCSQLGLAAWEEVPFYWFGGPEFLATLDRGIAQQLWYELLHRDASAPSVFFWGTSNESGWQDERRRFNAELHRLAHDYDGTRLVGQSAVGRHADDPTHEPLDVVGMTLYHGIFYGDHPRSGTAEGLAIAAERFPDKPIIVTEFGAWAGEDGGWQRWIFEETFAAIRENPRAAGALWWAAYDYASPRQDPQAVFHRFGLYDWERTTLRPVGEALRAAYGEALANDQLEP